MAFISRVGNEAAYIGNVFQGLLFDVLHQIGMEHWPDKVSEMPIDNWRIYLDYYRKALRSMGDDN